MKYKINVQKLADMCGYKLPTNVQNFSQKDLTEVKIFQNVSGGLLFSKHPVYCIVSYLCEQNVLLM